jgi:hypothetical protein
MKEILELWISTAIFRRTGFVACSLQAMESSVELDRKKQGKSESHWGALPIEPSIV